MSDKDAQITEQYQYSPYGLLLSGDSSKTPFLFNGMYGVMTDSNGLYYMRARFYSPEIKRFVNQDILLGSIGEGQTLNRYAFVTGQPVSFVDPFGLKLVNVNEPEGLKISLAEVIALAIEQIRSNKALRDWYNELLKQKGQNIEDILSGKLNCQVGVYYGNYHGKTRWDDIFPSYGDYTGQPNKSVGMQASYFNPWFLDLDDKRAAASLLIHELGHWVVAYSLWKSWSDAGYEIPKVPLSWYQIKPPGAKPITYSDIGDYLAQGLVDWELCTCGEE